MITQYVREGKPGAETALWIHGYTLDGTVWSDLWDALPQFRHVAVDLPGHGRSRPLRLDETLASVVEDVAIVASVERPALVIALSMGTVVALEPRLGAFTAFRCWSLPRRRLAAGQSTRMYSCVSRK